MKDMRRILSWGLILTLLFMNCVAFAGTVDSTYIDFEPTLANAMGLSADKWFSNGMYRAALTVLIALDMSSAYKAQGADFSFADTLYATSFVAKRYSELFIYLHGVGQDYIITYIPSQGTLEYMRCTPMSDSAAKSLTTSIYSDGYEGCYENRKSDIDLAIYALKEAVSN